MTTGEQLVVRGAMAAAHPDAAAPLGGYETHQPAALRDRTDSRTVPAAEWWGRPWSRS